VFDASLDYNLLLVRSWDYAMHVVVSTIFWVLCFLHEGQIVTIDELSLSHPDPSLGDSMVSMIDSPQLGAVNLGVVLFPSLMEAFYYPPPSSNVNKDPWNLPSPSTSMEGTGNPGMSMPLFATEVAYNIVQ
jgi:hypothetical protein